MKTFVSLFVSMVLGIVVLFAQDRDQIRDQDRDQTRLLLVDGDMLRIQDRDQIRIQDKLTLNDGTEVFANGTYQFKNQNQAQNTQRLKLKNGECLDMDGVLYRNEYQYRYKIEKENQGLTPEQVRTRNENRYMVMMVDGEAVQIMNQSQERLRNELHLGNGMVVEPNGQYQGNDGKRLQLQNGECLNMNGEMFKNQVTFRKEHMKKFMPTKQTMKKPNSPKKSVKKGKN